MDNRTLCIGIFTVGMTILLIVTAVSHFSGDPVEDSSAATSISVEEITEKVPLPDRPLHTYIPSEETTIPVVEVIPPRYGFTDKEVYLLAQLLCGSAKVDGDGEYDFVWAATYSEVDSVEISKVLCVVMNRVRSDSFPNTVTEVVMQNRQFSVMPSNASTVPSDIAIEYVQNWCNAYDIWEPDIQTIPEDHLYFSAGENCTNVTSTSWK